MKSLFKSVDSLLGKYYPLETKKDLQSSHINYNGNLSVVDFVLNFNTKGYEYVSNNLFEIFGMYPQELIEKGLVRGIDLFQKEHQELFVNEVIPKTFSVFEEAIEKGIDVRKCQVIYNIGMVGAKGNVISTTHIMQPIAVNQKGFPTLAEKYIICFPFDKTKKCDFKMQFKNQWGDYELFTKVQYEYEETGIQELSAREKVILEMVREGCSSKDIAEKLFLSIHTVNNHRRNILDKCNVKSIWHVKE